MSINTLLNKKYAPAPGGFKKLTIRLSQIEAEERQSLNLWSLAAACAVIALVALEWREFSGDREAWVNLAMLPKPGVVRVSQGEASPVPIETPGVKFYWLFR